MLEALHVWGLLLMTKELSLVYGFYSLPKCGLACWTKTADDSLSRNFLSGAWYCASLTGVYGGVVMPRVSSMLVSELCSAVGRTIRCVDTSKSKSLLASRL